MGFSFKTKIKSLLCICCGATSLYAGVSIYKNDEKFYKESLMPLIHLLDPERAHRLAVFISKYRLVSKSQFKDSNVLKIRIFGKEFSNPIGLAAGFDKNGEAVMGLKDIGFGFVEIGSVTPLPQPGNDKPRLFRLSEDRAVINRYGFNSNGHKDVLMRMEQLRRNPDLPIIGLNLGKNKTSEDPVKDYVDGIETFGRVSDYLVINISSPNTPNLRTLQNKENLRHLLKAVVAARNALDVNPKPPLLLKLAPDLTEQEKKDIANIISEKDCKVEGLIISNTTIERPSLKSAYQKEAGGLSGAPLRDVSTQMIKEMTLLTKGDLVIIGVGGIFTGKDAYEKIRAGASLVQVYSSMVYEGPPIISKIKRELEDILKKEGHENIIQIIGKDVRK
ncbi:hypothetical protein ABEB36_003753 [Hypothenemus hampei]|uniref:Dihydroorotate dehydrogenase (quinone), mitochondrial n=1 Tax=Hypothenemus hampei TaxID=57062 RepID=A0ABD1F110_HYPHA